MQEPAEKVGLRNAWGRVAETYEDGWARRTAGFTAAGLDALHPPEGARGLDIACGPGADHRRPRRAAGDGGGPRGGLRALHGREGGRAPRGPPGARVRGGRRRAALQPDAAFDVVTCSFGLMYCYDAAAAVRDMRRVVRPGGRVLNVVWGRAPNVWFVPIIELIESRAEYYSAVCPLMFFYGLPGVLPRMLDEAGLETVVTRTIDGRLGYPTVEEAVEAAIVAGPLWACSPTGSTRPARPRCARRSPRTWRAWRRPARTASPCRRRSSWWWASAPYGRSVPRRTSLVRPMVIRTRYGPG